MFSTLKHLNRLDIDDVKWNERIKTALISRVYGYTWYLDAMTDGLWSAYVSDDYSIVMPLYVKKKMLLPYITQPILCQQLGIFHQKDITIDEAQIVSKLSTKYLQIDCLMAGNISGNKNFTTKSNHILDLSKNYEDLFQNYHRNTRRNILHALKSNVVIEENIDINSLVQFLKTYDITGIVQEKEKNIVSLIQATQTLGNALILGTKDQHSIHSVAYFIKDDKRIYFLLCASDDKGKETKDMYLLIDHVIKKYADSHYIFDFTGSNIPNIARRNVGFGAETEVYTHFRYRKWFLGWNK